jgi:hypothetical protein
MGSVAFRLKSPPMKEADVLRQVKAILQIHRWLVIRIQQGMGCHKGVSDLVAIKDGRTVWIECKAPAGKLSPYQQRFCQDITAAGGQYFVVRNMDDLRNIL